MTALIADCWGSIGEQEMQCYISLNLFGWTNKLICNLNGLRVSTFSANFHFWVNCSFNYDEWSAPIASCAARWHVVPLLFERPVFESRLVDLSRSRPPSLSNYVSCLTTVLKKVKTPNINLKKKKCWWIISHHRYWISMMNTKVNDQLWGILNRLFLSLTALFSIASN